MPLSDNSIVVPLDNDTNLTDGNAKGCVQNVSKNVMKAIRQHPDQYYVNVHTDQYAGRRDSRRTSRLDIADHPVSAQRMPRSKSRRAHPSPRMTRGTTMSGPT